MENVLRYTQFYSQENQDRLQYLFQVYTAVNDQFRKAFVVAASRLINFQYALGDQQQKIAAPSLRLLRVLLYDHEIQLLYLNSVWYDVSLYTNAFQDFFFKTDLQEELLDLPFMQQLIELFVQFFIYKDICVELSESKEVLSFIPRLGGALDMAAQSFEN